MPWNWSVSNSNQIGIILMPKSINESPVKYLQNIPLVYSKYTFQDLPNLPISASEIIRHFHNSTLSVSVKTENIAEKMSTNWNGKYCSCYVHLKGSAHAQLNSQTLTAFYSNRLTNTDVRVIGSFSSLAFR